MRHAELALQHGFRRNCGIGNTSGSIIIKTGGASPGGDPGGTIGLEIGAGSLGGGGRGGGPSESIHTVIQLPIQELNEQPKSLFPPHHTAQPAWQTIARNSFVDRPSGS
jgi:hypothetical protein